MISAKRIERAISALAHVDGAQFDSHFLVQDVVGVAVAFPDFDDFEAAIASTVRALKLVLSGKAATSSLSDDYEGWECFHYQHRVSQGARATMRMMFKRTDGGIRVRGFGNRRIPEDFYRRMACIGRAEGPV